LDALARRSGSQFQAGTIRTPRSGGQHCQLGMELLPELFEQLEMNAHGVTLLRWYIFLLAANIGSRYMHCKASIQSAQ